MPAYVILGITVTNPDLFEEYKKIAPATIGVSGGRYIARGGKAETLEGDWIPNRVVILEFENSEIAKNWLNSPEYREARSMRLQAATSNTSVEGGVGLGPHQSPQETFTTPRHRGCEAQEEAAAHHPLRGAISRKETFAGALSVPVKAGLSS